MSSLDDRVCPHPRCELVIHWQQFACRQHWFSLPGEIRAGINRAWRNVTGHDGIARLEAAQQRAHDWWAT